MNVLKNLRSLLPRNETQSKAKRKANKYFKLYETNKSDLL